MSELIYAAKHGYNQQVISLLNSGACVNDRDKDEATALYYSACSGNRDICVALLESGSDANSKVKWGSTPLHAAADRGHIFCVKILLKFGSNPNTQNNRGESPLHLSAYRGYLEIVNILISVRSNPFLQNKSHKTPAQESESQNHRIIAHRLYEYMSSFEMGTLNERQNIANIPRNKRYPFVKSFSETSMFSQLENHQNPILSDSEPEENDFNRMGLNDLNRVRDSDRTANKSTALHRKLCRTDTGPNSYGGHECLAQATASECNAFVEDDITRDVSNGLREHGDAVSEIKSMPVAAYAEALQLKIVQLQQDNEKLTKDYSSKEEDLIKCKRTLDNYQCLLLRYSKDREHLKKTIQKSNSLGNPKANPRIVSYASVVSDLQGARRHFWKINYTHSRFFQFLRSSSDCTQAFANSDDDLKDALKQAFPFWEAKNLMDTSEKEWRPPVDYVFRERQPLNQRRDGGRDGSLIFKISREGKPYILKMMINLLNVDLTKHGDGNSMTGFLSANFGSEYKIPLKLSSHPGILKIYKHYEGSLEHFREYMSLLVPKDLDVPVEMANRSTFLVLKEYPKTLMNLVVDQRNRHKEAPYGLSEQFILHVLFQLLSTLCYLQQNGVVHRDIKADNVFLDWRLRPVLGDFRFARKLYNADGLDIPWTSSGDINAGNPRAWAPELVRSSRMEPQSLPKDLSLRKVYERADAFAVARMFYNLLCPLDDDCYFPRASMERPHYADEEIPSLPSCYSEEICYIMKKLVLSDPSQRITAKEAQFRIGTMLFGPKAGELRDKNDVKIYKQSRMVKLLGVEVQETEPDEPSFHLSVEETVEINSPWIEANFLSQVTEDELWDIYTEKS